MSAPVRPGAGRWRSTLAAVVGLVALLVSSGCVGLPDAGPVTVPDAAPLDSTTAGVDYVPPGPTPGESPAEIVQHFLGAMRATSFQTRVARSFLTRSAAETWRPETRTIVYDDVSRPATGTRVTVDLTGAAELDAQGRWLGAGASSTRQISFGMEEEDGEWRIASLPDALIVPLTWLEARYAHVEVYFLDPSARVLVPTPAFLPGGDQLPARLAAALLDGPGSDLTGVATTAFGGIDARGLTVDVASDGVATVRLTSSGGVAPTALTEPMVAQLAWTLRQVPSVARVQVRVDDVPLPTPDGGTSFAVTAGQRYAPDVFGADPGLYGLAPGGEVVEVSAGGAAVAGAERLAAVGPQSLSLSVDGRTATGLAADGDLLVVALDDPAGAPRTYSAVGRTQVGWDFADRAWVLDGGREARVRMVAQGSAEVIQVPGVSGQQVQRLLVSRDGSRLVAVVGAPGAQRVVVTRVRYDERGGVLDAVPQPSELDVPVADGEVLVDIGWRSPTELVVLSRLPGGLAELQRVAVDGSRTSTSDTDVLVTDADRVVTSPTPGSQLLLVAPDGVTQEWDGSRLLEFDARGVAALTYAG